MNCAIHTDQPATAYCRTCGKALCNACQRAVNGVVYCEPCLAARLQDTATAGPQPPRPTSQVILEQGLGIKNVRNPNAVMAALLAIIPGVGAMYNGQFLKGLIYAGIFAVLIAISTHDSGLFGMAVAAFYIYMIFDAYHSAKAIAAGQPAPDPLGLDRFFGAGVGTGSMSPSFTPVPPVAPPPAGFAPSPAATAYTPVNVPVYVAPPPPPAEDFHGKAPLAAIILVGLGLLFFLQTLGVYESALHQLWPIILIAVGGWLFARRWNR